MADEADQTAERMEYDDKINRYKSRKDEPDIKQPIGECLSCGAELSSRRWCDADCRDLWELENRT
jgi:hypothetical protein